MALRKRIGLTAVQEMILVLGMVLLACGLRVNAQSVLGDYHGTALIGDTSGEVTPVEFVQSVDLGLSIDQTKEGEYTGSVSLRRLYRDPATGRLADAQAPLASLVINKDYSFQAASAPIGLRLGGRTVERIVTITGVFVFGEGQCIPTIEAEYLETVNRLVFRPLQLSGPLSMARARETAADDECLAQMNVE